MLGKIKIDGLDILLRRGLDGNPEPTIFDVDSLSLLIGPNGAGKTLTLMKIATALERMNGKTETSWSAESSFEFYSKLASPADYAVVYYTPVPSAPPLVSDGKVFNASPRAGHVLDARADSDFQEVLELLEISKRKEASLRFDIRRVAELIAELLVLGMIFPSPRWYGMVAFKSDLAARPERAVSVDSFQGVVEAIDQLTKTDQSVRLRLPRNTGAISSLLRERAMTSHHALGDLAAVAKALEQFPRNKGGSDARMLVFAYCVEGLDCPADPRFQREYEDEILNHPSKALEFRRLAQKISGLIANEPYELIRHASELSAKFSTEAVAKFRDAELNGQYIFDIRYTHVSSGEWAVLCQMTALVDAIRQMTERGHRAILLLIDEGDSFLHLEWQRKYLFLLNAVLGKLKRELAKASGLRALQVIVATHSPLLATDVPRHYVCRLNDKNQREDVSRTFAAPLQSLLNASFGADSIGAMAEDAITKSVKRLKSGQVIELDRLIVGWIDDPLIRREVEELLEDADEQSRS